LKVTASGDGKEFQPVRAERKSFSSGHGDYGYLAPILFQGSSLPSGARYLRFSLLSGDNSAYVEAQKPPAGGGESAFPLQISRVEIDLAPGE
jgi:hypothetical protein